jgi:hypothetical protein
VLGKILLGYKPFCREKTIWLRRFENSNRSSKAGRIQFRIQTGFRQAQAETVESFGRGSFFPRVDVFRALVSYCYFQATSSNQWNSLQKRERELINWPTAQYSPKMEIAHQQGVFLQDLLW